MVDETESDRERRPQSASGDESPDSAPSIEPDHPESDAAADSQEKTPEAGDEIASEQIPGASDSALPGPPMHSGSDETVRNDEAEPKSRKGGVLLSVFVLIIALVALAASGYVFWRIEFANPLESESAALTEKLTTVDRRNAAENEKLREELSEEIERLARATGDHSKAIAMQERVLAEAVAAQQNAGPPRVREWKLAEVEYLLRVANHRLLMERDVRGASQLLGAADAILEELDDFALHEVRAALVEEQSSLRRVAGIDTQGVFLRIEALKNDLATLPLRLPAYTGREAEPDSATAPEEPETAGSALDRAANRLFSLFEFRRHEGLGAKPLLKPEEATYLEQNLRLALERAQLAALRHEQVLYETSLESVHDWLREYLDEGHSSVRWALDEVDALLELDLEVELPDISGALRRLIELRAVDIEAVAESLEAVRARRDEK